VADCEACKVMAAMPATAPRHPWQHPNAPWDKVHIDFSEWNSHHFLVLVDAFSKWPEVRVVLTTTTRMIVNVLSDIFQPSASLEYLCLTMGHNFLPQNLTTIFFRTTLFTTGYHHTTYPQMGWPKIW